MVWFESDPSGGSDCESTYLRSPSFMGLCFFFFPDLSHKIKVLFPSLLLVKQTVLLDAFSVQASTQKMSVCG